jgi:hypothetical protein
VNLAIVTSGARLDLGENELALAELEIPELNPAKVFSYSPPLFRAYADTLELLGRKEDATKWFDLANRAEVALAGKPEDVLEIIEEIEIPKLADRPARTSSDDETRKPYGRASSGGRDSGKPRRGFDNPGGERRGAPRGR